MIVCRQLSSLFVVVWKMASPLPNELSGDSNSSVYRTKVSQYLEREDNLLIPPANFYRSNSFTLQEQGGHTSSQIRKAALNHDFAKRRMSRSLPELRNFRIAPVIVDNSYIESIYSDDTDSYVVHDFSVQPIWNNKGDLFLTCIGLSLGLSNFWRYSYLSYISPGMKGVLLLSFLVRLLSRFFLHRLLDPDAFLWLADTLSGICCWTIDSERLNSFFPFIMPTS